MGDVTACGTCGAELEGEWRCVAMQAFASGRDRHAGRCWTGSAPTAVELERDEGYAERARARGAARFRQAVQLRLEGGTE